MDEHTIQQKIDALPKIHPPRGYTVYLSDKRGVAVGIRLVRASSQARAELTGLRVERYIYGNRKAIGAKATLSNPIQEALS